MMNNGFSCDNTMLPYTLTVTACGHTCVYTGSVPNIHGIVGNNWYDIKLNKEVYCTEDKTVVGIGTTACIRDRSTCASTVATPITMSVL